MTRKKYRVILWTMLMTAVVFSIVFYVGYVKDNIPDDIYVEPYSTEQIKIDIPFVGTFSAYDERGEVAAASVNLMDVLEISSADKMSYEMEVRLFGIFNIKNVNITVKEPESVIACGIPVGIYLETEGVLVVDVGSVKTSNGISEAPANGILMGGDYITAVNGKYISDKNELVNYIQNSGGEYIVFTIIRNDEETDVKIKPVRDKDGYYRIGVWIRDDCQGLGTLTYINGDNEFGALGHAICEENSGEKIKLKEGKIYTAKIWSIIKSEKGNPGEVIGSINYGNGNCLGTVTSNETIGVYGEGNESIYAYADKIYLKTAYKQDVKTGAATVRTYVGGEVKDYDICIEELSYSEKKRNKGIVFSVTDEELLGITNGIVQGMSGSPIIQDGKVVGAVTHVLVDEPEKGYGIFIENMLEH